MATIITESPATAPPRIGRIGDNGGPAEELEQAPPQEAAEALRALRFASAHLGLALALNPAIFLANTRGNQRESFARQLLMHLAHVSMSIPQVDIAAALKREPKTVAYAVQVIEELRDDPRKDAAFEFLGKSISIGWALHNAHRKLLPPPKPVVSSKGLER